jgi:endonuclease YncB( thermonuclease family)
MIAPAYVYRATCDRVKDGDTIVARIELGFYVSTAVPVRIAGVNAPEVHGASRTAGLAAAAFLHDLLTPDDVLPWDMRGAIRDGARIPLLLQSHHDDRSFERWVCDIWLPDGRSVAQALIDAGHGTVV